MMQIHVKMGDSAQLWTENLSVLALRSLKENFARSLKVNFYY